MMDIILISAVMIGAQIFMAGHSIYLSRKNRYLTDEITKLKLDLVSANQELQSMREKVDEYNFLSAEHFDEIDQRDEV